MPYAHSSRRKHQAPRTEPAKPALAPITPEVAMETLTAVYSDAHRQLVAVDMYMSSYEDKVEYHAEYVYGAWHGSDWRIQVATLADTLRAKLERVYLPTLNATAAHPGLSPATAAALREREHRTVAVLKAIGELDTSMVGILSDSTNTSVIKAALRAAKQACRHAKYEVEEAMYALFPDRAAAWVDLCLRRSATMVPYTSWYQ